MSTVILDTITGKSTATTITIGSTPVVSASANSMTIRGEGSNQTSIQQGLCKAWVLATSNLGAISDSLNIGGSTDNGTGDYTFSFTNNMANTNFSAQQSAAEDNVRTCVNKIRAVGSFRISFFDQNGAAQDAATSAGVHGDLA